MRTTVIFVALLLISSIATVLDATAQVVDRSVRGWVSIYPLTIDGANGGSDRNTTAVSFSGSQVDTTARIYFEGQDYVVDSVQYCIVTKDTARYRVSMLYGVGTGTSGPFLDYNYYSGAGLDTLGAPLATASGGPAVANGVYSAAVCPPGVQWQALVIQYSAAGNHDTASRITSLKAQVYAKVFYRYKRV